MVILIVLQVSAPYSNNDLTLELKRQVFVAKDKSLELQIFVSCMKAALAIFALTSVSVPPCWSLMLAR